MATRDTKGATPVTGSDIFDILAKSAGKTRDKLTSQDIETLGKKVGFSQKDIKRASEGLASANKGFSYKLAQDGKSFDTVDDKGQLVTEVSREAGSRKGLQVKDIFSPKSKSMNYLAGLASSLSQGQGEEVAQPAPTRQTSETAPAPAQITQAAPASTPVPTAGRGKAPAKPAAPQATKPKTIPDLIKAPTPIGPLDNVFNNAPQRTIEQLSVDPDVDNVFKKAATMKSSREQDFTYAPDVHKSLKKIYLQRLKQGENVTAKQIADEYAQAGNMMVLESAMAFGTAGLGNAYRVARTANTLAKPLTQASLKVAPKSGLKEAVTQTAKKAKDFFKPKKAPTVKPKAVDVEREATIKAMSERMAEGFAKGGKIAANGGQLKKPSTKSLGFTADSLLKRSPLNTYVDTSKVQLDKEIADVAPISMARQNQIRNAGEQGKRNIAGGTGTTKTPKTSTGDLGQLAGIILPKVLANKASKDAYKKVKGVKSTLPNLSVPIEYEPRRANITPKFKQQMSNDAQLYTAGREFENAQINALKAQENAQIEGSLMEQRARNIGIKNQNENIIASTKNRDEYTNQQIGSQKALGRASDQIALLSDAGADVQDYYAQGRQLKAMQGSDAFATMIRQGVPYEEAYEKAYGKRPMRKGGKISAKNLMVKC